MILSPILPPPDRQEILRYAGVKMSDPATEALLEETLPGATQAICPKAAYRVYPITPGGEVLDLGFAASDSKALQKRLHGCKKLLVLAATLGLEYDRLLARTALCSPARALLLQAIGAERIEALCDRVCACAQEEYKTTDRLLSRFSPGYGELPLAMQQEIFAALDCSRQLGMTLNESYAISPSKSVTALAGLESLSQPAGKL